MWRAAREFDLDSSGVHHGQFLQIAHPYSMGIEHSFGGLHNKSGFALSLHGPGFPEYSNTDARLVPWLVEAGEYIEAYQGVECR